MRIPITRHQIKVYPDSKRVIARFFINAEVRARDVVQRVMNLSEDEVFAILSPLLQEYSRRHRNITKVWYRHCNRLKPIIVGMGLDFDELQQNRRLLLGAYFTHEYSIE